eukprot:NODE_1084_length_679_cov_207.798413_g845_i0.p1 GENE.NODE_1084_length_679_cov_207.798413_g845_i0~~NODE_1084_length_679_cov_207.798413_g845_i0.p1  ORF type:complete len:87 (+),score=16.90 NODE_1084_length_679_cov_207.798413_g845_i0:26-262(+)
MGVIMVKSKVIVENKAKKDPGNPKKHEFCSPKCLGDSCVRDRGFTFNHTSVGSSILMPNIPGPFEPSPFSLLVPSGDL